MMEFKSKADEIIRARWGIQVEHICAQRKKMDGSGEMEKVTYETLFYHVPNRKGGERETAQDKRYTQGTIWGFLSQLRVCTSYLKQNPIKRLLGMASHHQQLLQTAQNPVCTDSPTQSGAGATASRRGAICQFSSQRPAQGAKINIVQYLGIAADEPERIARHTKRGVLLPLVEAGLKESDCRKWCEDNGLLSPIYTTMNRGGAGFVITKACKRCALCAKPIRNIGRSCSSGTKTAPAPSSQTGIPSTITNCAFPLRRQAKCPQTEPSGGRC